MYCNFKQLMQKKGFETTATSATTTFALLAMHPDIQEKLFQEIRSVLPNQTDDPTRENIQNMPYLDAFLKESFRFYPTVPFLTRIVKKEMQLGWNFFVFFFAILPAN